jgi:hypothetical protein
MTDFSKATIFYNQSIIIKTTILLVGSVASILVPIRALILLFAVTLLYLALSLRIYKSVGKGILVIMPFLASYSVLALVFNLDYIEMVVFICRLIYLVTMLSVFVASFNVKRVLAELQRINRQAFFNKAVFFLIATMIFIKRFRNYYLKGNQPKKKSINFSAIVNQVVNAIHTIWQDKESVLQETEALLAKHYSRPMLITKSNTLGMAFLTMLILILSI